MIRMKGKACAVSKLDGPSEGNSSAEQDKDSDSESSEEEEGLPKAKKVIKHY